MSLSPTKTSLQASSNLCTAETLFSRYSRRRWRSSKIREILDLSGTQLKKWVGNISKHKLSQGETSVLAKGLSFAVTPQKLPFEDFVVAIYTEQATVGLKEAKANILRNDVLGILTNARPPQPNINAEERKALKDLASNKEITILPADKRKTTVVMDTQEYKDKVSFMLSDKKTYELLTSDPTSFINAN